MKIEFTNSEKRKMEEIKDTPVLFGKNSIGKEYALTFTVQDPIKAEILIRNLLFSRNREKEDDLGVDFTGINLKYMSTKDKEKMLMEIQEVIHKYM